MQMQWKSLKQLQIDPTLQSRDAKKKYQKRFDKAITPSHLLANIVHPSYRGKSLTDIEYSTGMDLAATEHNSIVPDLINYKPEAVPFQSFMFQQNVMNTVKPLDWWKSQTNQLNKETVTVVNQLLTPTASSVGLERVFLSFGLVHSNLRNRLGVEKAGKLVFLFKVTNKKPADGEEHLYSD